VRAGGMASFGMTFELPLMIAMSEPSRWMVQVLEERSVRKTLQRGKFMVRDMELPAAENRTQEMPENTNAMMLLEMADEKDLRTTALSIHIKYLEDIFRTTLFIFCTRAYSVWD
jgi:hypothetical protein